MKGDFTRFSHQPEEHYAGVLMQQGRVTLDADWNEQFDIDDHRWRAQTIDTIGRACAPEGNAGFALSFTPDGQDLIIHPGRIYVDGILVELLEGSGVRVILTEGEEIEVSHLSPDDHSFEIGEWVELFSDETSVTGGPSPTLAKIVNIATVVDAAGQPPRFVITINADAGAHDGQTDIQLRRVVTCLTQPFYPADAGSPFGESFDPTKWADRTHLAYLDVWRRHVTAIEDPDIREVALGGTDTATRVQTVWALRFLRDPQTLGEPADASQISCHDSLPLWDALTSPSAGRLSARAEAAPNNDDPCAVQPGAGYRGLENRLYRVEIHEPGPIGTASFKWSRDNGSVLSSIVSFPAGDRVEVHSLGKDEVLRFSADDRVEAFSETSELSGTPGTMASIVGSPDEANRVISLDQDVSVYEGNPVPRLRRWDNATSEPLAENAWIDLELGVQVRFGAGPFHVGDYWVIPARVATGDVEGFVEAPPRGVDHHFARLALVTWAGQQVSENILDCRSTFPPLCGITSGHKDHCCTVSVGPDGDFVTLQEAVDSLKGTEGPARICILPGEHRLVEPTIITRSDLTISGCGRTSRLVAMVGSAIVIEESSDVRIEDLWILSASSEPTILTRWTDRFELIDCRIANFGPQAHVDATHSTDHSRLLGPGLRVDGGKSVVVRHIMFQASPATSAQTDRLTFEHNHAQGGGVHVREGSEFILIKGNTMIGGARQGVLIGGLEGDEEPRDDRAGLTDVVVESNEIEGMGREGISTDLRFRSEVDGMVITGNQIRHCGTDPLRTELAMGGGSPPTHANNPQGDELAIGGGILLTDASDVRIHNNVITQNGPPESSHHKHPIGFGIAVGLTAGLTVSDNTIANNGPRLEQREFGLNFGVIGLGVTAVDPKLNADAPDKAMATLTGNTITSREGPAVVLLGVGSSVVSSNNLTAQYTGPNLINFGRAVLIANLGASPDTNVAASGAMVAAWPVSHGRVQLNSNQITVQTGPGGLSTGSIPIDHVALSTGQLVGGSAVAVLTFDDLSIVGNQVLNEISREPHSERPPILSSVWSMATTLRSTNNRITEVPGTALLSYFGAALGHIVTENITTHCIRAEGTTVIERDNITLRCKGRESFAVERFFVWEG